VALGFCKLVPELAVMAVVDTAGRRPLLISSAAGVTAVMYSLCLCFVSGAKPSVAVFLLCAYMVAFSLGMGPVTWLLASEMLPSRARAKGMTLCSFVNRLVSGSVALSALSTCDAFGFAGFFALCK